MAPGMCGRSERLTNAGKIVWPAADVMPAQEILRMRYSLVLIALAALAASPRGQQVFRVGPTQPFATIGAATGAASTGDLIGVDPGSYPAFDINDHSYKWWTPLEKET